ncbi:MAG: DUF1553 domain-containing protein [Planctomycetota bacterium]
MKFNRLLSFAVTLMMALNQARPGQGADRPVDFTRDIRTILSNNCFFCHGPDTKERKGGTDGLRFDTAEGIVADLGDGKRAVVPGQPEKSELMHRVRSVNADEVMPPKSSGKKLTPHEIELLNDWIKQGGKYAAHWSYVKPVRSPLPKIQDTAWPKNEIDHFLLARLDKEGLRPAVEADKYALIRRVSLDLTGLPPTIEEVEAFVNDADPKAYEKLVDRLLAKPAFGEHWAQMWLDLSRYADSAGYADDPPRTIWLFRDYVIRSLNQNKPFNQFTIEQIAGDLLPNPTEDQLIATAFHRNTLTNNEGGTNDEEFRNVAIVDRVNTTMAVWMGTTITCCQCHNHKYDPISQEEYYKLFAFFNNTDDADRRDESPLLSILTDSQKQQQADWKAEFAKLEPILKTATPELKAAQTKWESAFPLNLTWSGLKPSAVKSEAGSATKIDDTGIVQVAAGAKNDAYTVDVPLEASTIRALRLEALPDDSLPGKGPGHMGGNFVVSKVSAVVTPPTGASLLGRFVRVELPGKATFLSLAEVQVFQGAENIAVKGEASQISVDFEGPAKLAIDGNTNGHFHEAKSTTHTAAGDNPWWEVDLKSVQKIDRIAIWNRTDGAGERLANFKLIVFNDKHEPIWQQQIATAPKPNSEFPLNGQRAVEFQVALASYSQASFEAANVLNGKDLKAKGWAVGGATGQAHSLTLITKSPLEIPAGSTLSLVIDQQFSQPNHTLGKFKLSVTNESQVEEWAKTPAGVIEALRVPVATRTAAQTDLITQHFLAIAAELEPTRKQIAALQKQLADLKPETVPIMKELMANRRVSKIQHRGNFQDLGAEVTEGTPAVFPPLPADVPKNRLALAKWLVDENNPLTARVITNRYWEQLFGIGIVATSEEFGTQGDQPVHPELLDWLATEIVRLNWDTKAFLKTLVMSAAYRQSSKVTPELQQRDPENRLLARGPRFRLSAEALRDQAMVVSGLLSPRMYGPPVKPMQPSIGLSAAFGSGIDWQTSGGDDKYRRGLYTTWRRSNPYPSMATFDAPNREVCTVRRGRTNTPLQALVTLNDPVYIEAAQALARKIVASGGATSADRARYGFRTTLARPPQDAELARLVTLYEQSLAKFSQNAAEAKRLATDPLGPEPAGANVAELAAWTVVSNVLLNLDETLMKR